LACWTQRKASAINKKTIRRFLLVQNYSRKDLFPRPWFWDRITVDWRPLLAKLLLRWFRSFMTIFSMRFFLYSCARSVWMVDSNASIRVPWENSIDNKFSRWIRFDHMI
jgi:hypothetical protein